MRYVAMVAASAAVLGFFAATRGEPAQAQAGAAATGTVGQEDFRWAGRVARGQQIEIRAIVGTVRAEVTNGDQVEVVGVRRGDNAAAVRIEVVEDEDGVTICTIHPIREGRERRRDQDYDGEGPCRQSGDIDTEDARVDFVVRVPAGVKFAATTVAGDIIAEGLRNAVNVASVSGNVRVATTGTARAATVNGDVTASLGETDGGEMEFVSVSGNVTVRLPRDVDAEVSAHTMSGEIESDFDLERGPMARGDDDDEDDDGGLDFDIRIGESASGKLGRGGPELSVTTISGNIRLERAR